MSSDDSGIFILRGTKLWQEYGQQMAHRLLTKGYCIDPQIIKIVPCIGQG